jgi:hypothetical protein
MEVLKVGFLFLAVIFTLVNTTRAFNRAPIKSINFTLQAVGIVGFVVRQFKL